MGEAALGHTPSDEGEVVRHDGEAAGFDFDQNGLDVEGENSPTPSAGEILKVGFTVFNTGTAAGSAHVSLEIDGADSGVVWDSPPLEPGQHATPDGDGYVHSVPAQSEGTHHFVAIVEPAGPHGGRSPTEISIGAAE
jgi:hypothetical protein